MKAVQLHQRLLPSDNYLSCGPELALDRLKALRSFSNFVGLDECGSCSHGYCILLSTAVWVKFHKSHPQSPEILALPTCFWV